MLWDCTSAALRVFHKFIINEKCMRIKSILFAAILILFAGSLSFSQTDSLKTLTVKGQKVVIGKYYEIIYPLKPSEKGKLIAVNKTTILYIGFHVQSNLSYLESLSF